MLQYSQIRAGHRRSLEAKRRRVLTMIPEYRELEERVPGIAAEALRRRLGRTEDSGAGISGPAADASGSVVKASVPSANASGSSADASGPSSVRASLAAIAARKKELLRENGFPEDYLEMEYDCPECKDTGLIDGRKCRCFKKRELALLYDQSHLGTLISEAGFDKLSEEYYSDEDLRLFRRARAESLRFVSGFGTEYGNLYFYGTVGTGKSFLSACIAGAVMEKGYTVLYYSASALFDRLASLSFDYRFRDEMRTLSDDLYHCDLLIIDDLGTELTNQFVSAQLFTCLTERHLNRKATIISTNLSLEEMQRRYSDRLFSRITSSYTICKLTGKDIRILKKTAHLNNSPGTKDRHANKKARNTAQWNLQNITTNGN